MLNKKTDAVVTSVLTIDKARNRKIKLNGNVTVMGSFSKKLSVGLRIAKNLHNTILLTASQPP